jgi:hypothetical protein
VSALIFAASALAHGVASGDQAYIQANPGAHIGPFVYLGAKHMVTGYDHLLFLVGVIFFLYRLREVALYVSLFAIGHSTTLIVGVLAGTNVNPHAVDAVIGLSVAYKGLDNLGLFERRLGFQPDTRAAVLLFGLVHGFGLATKLQALSISPDGLVPNLIAFNVGVEAGQFLALAAILVAMGYWRRSDSFGAYARVANGVLVALGVALCVFQLQGWLA